MRLVSVVVPLWLTATTSVSLMSRRSPKPGQLGGRDRRRRRARRRRSSSSSAATLLPGDRRRALADDADLADRPVGQPGGDVGGQRALADRRRAARRRARRSCRAASCGSSSGASVISFSRKCGASPRSMSRVVISAVTTSAALDGQLACRRRRSRVDAVERRRRGRVEHDHLTAAARRRRRLAVHAQVALGLLDHAVRLAGDDEAVLGEADVERPGRCRAGRGSTVLGVGRRSPRRSPPSPRTRRRCGGTPRRGRRRSPSVAAPRAPGSPWRRW